MRVADKVLGGKEEEGGKKKKSKINKAWGTRARLSVGAVMAS